jgi:hypothetical protein
MTYPVVEQIAQKIVTRLETIDQGNGYSVTVREVVRPRRRAAHSPINGMAVLQLDSFAQDQDEIASLGVKLRRTATFAIDYYVEPADSDPRPYDQLQAIAIAEIEKALAIDFYESDSGAYAGVGYNARLETPQLIRAEDDSSAGVRVRISVDYQHTDLDPYTPL